MKNEEDIKQMVKARYSRIAEQGAAQKPAPCCGGEPPSGEEPGGEVVYDIMSESYQGLEGYVSDADLGLGCGLPTQFARIAPGDTVIDLGSGAGNDCFVARHETGAAGRVIGIDFSPAMIARARANAEKMGFTNVEFREGELEAMPVPDATADVIVSNCVLNLVPNKARVFAEIFRVLKPGGHFSLSDIVLVGSLPDALRQDAELYAGCVAGAIQKADYLATIARTGFAEIQVQKEKGISLPQSLLAKYLSPEQAAGFNRDGAGIFSITVFGKKPNPAAS